MSLPLVAALALTLAASVSSAPTPVVSHATHAGVAGRFAFVVHREVQIARLQEYADAGVFPHNTTSVPALHMFEDEAGRRCAVAELLHDDGRDDLVATTVATRNDLAIADVHEGAMMNWVLSSGFTQEELVRIQLPNSPMFEDHPIAMRVKRPAPVIAVAPAKLTEAQMQAAVRAHLTTVLAELRTHRTAGIALANERRQASLSGAT